MINVLRHTAQRNRGSVGSSCIITSFPVSALPLEVGQYWDLDMPSVETFRSREVSLFVEGCNDSAASHSFLPTRINETVIWSEGVINRGTQGFDAYGHMQRFCYPAFWKPA